MMLSTCPSCLSQISHKENESQVSCECGEKFSPFMRPDEWSTEMEDVSIGAPKFAESESAFQEIRDFGEGLDTPTTPKQAPAQLEDSIDTMPMSEDLSPVSEKTTIARPIATTLVGNALITTATEISGYQIDSYLLPISLLSPLTEGAESPLDDAFHKIWEKAQQLGANAIIDLKWKIFPDGTRVLMTATPVTCQKLP